MVLLDGWIIGYRRPRDGINIHAAPRLKFILLWRLRLAGSGMATVAHFIQTAHRDRVRRNCETLGNSKNHDK